MNDATHTPGPWATNYVADDHDTAGLLTIEIDDGRSLDGTDAIAEVFGVATGREYSRPREEQEANARLIAAAPDLLAACEAAVGVMAKAVAIRVKLTGVSTGGAADVLAKLQAAAAKARGGA